MRFNTWQYWKLLHTPVSWASYYMYSLVQWKWFSVVTRCTWVTCMSDVREPISLHQAVHTAIQYQQVVLWILGKNKKKQMHGSMTGWNFKAITKTKKKERTGERRDTKRRPSFRPSSIQVNQKLKSQREFESKRKNILRWKTRPCFLGETFWGKEHLSLATGTAFLVAFFSSWQSMSAVHQPNRLVSVTYSSDALWASSLGEVSVEFWATRAFPQVQPNIGIDMVLGDTVYVWINGHSRNGVKSLSRNATAAIFVRAVLHKTSHLDG